MKFTVLFVFCASWNIVRGQDDYTEDVTGICCTHGSDGAVALSGAQECSSLGLPDYIEPEQESSCRASAGSCCRDHFKQKDDCAAGSKYAAAKRCSVPSTDIGKTCCEECTFGLLTGESQGVEACGGPAETDVSPTTYLRKNAFYKCCVEAATKPETTTQKVTTTSTVAPAAPRQRCSPGSCKKDQECDDTDGTVRCRCRSGYRMHRDGSCRDINECAEAVDNICTKEDHVCHNTPGSFKCVPLKKREVGLSCPPGFKRNVLNQVCDDINECQLPRPPCPKYLCENTIGGYRCGGKPGTPVVEGATEPPPAPGAPPPRNDICPKGFRAGANDECIDIDECDEHLDDCQRLSQHCINTHGSFFCQDHVSKRCAPGFKVNSATGICEDINECEEGSEVCRRNQICINLPGAYDCKSKISTLPKLTTKTCQEGTRMRVGSNKCDDIDECREGTHLCDQFQNCINTFGGHECRCKNGFELDSTSGSCEDIDECAMKLDNCAPGLYCLNVLGSFTCTRRAPTTSTSTSPSYDYEYTEYTDEEDPANDTRNEALPEPPVTRPTPVRPPPPPKPTTTPTTTTSTTTTTTPKPTTTSTTTTSTTQKPAPRPPYRPPQNNPYGRPNTRPYTSRPPRPNPSYPNTEPKPEDPRRPERPEDPRRPENPEDPGRPRPEDPRRPENPDDPRRPRPEDPRRPEHPEDPRRPRPEDPRWPENPEDPRRPRPEDPRTPENPEDPRRSRPEDPRRPDNPEDPRRPERPEYPSRPERPVDRRRPERPEDPRRPEDTRRPSRPDDPRRPNRPEDPRRPDRLPSVNVPAPTDPAVVEKERNPDGGYEIDTGYLPEDKWTNVIGKDKDNKTDSDFDVNELHCLNGYEKNEFGECVDVDECKGRHICSALETCKNEPGKYRCDCISGFRRDSSGSCAVIPFVPTPTTTSTTTPATTTSTTTVAPSRPDWTYTPPTQSRPSPRFCEMGYTFEPRQGKCADIDECAANRHTCVANERCVNIDGGFQCEKAPSYAPLAPAPTPTRPRASPGEPHVITVGAQYGSRGPRYRRPAYSRIPEVGGVTAMCQRGYRLTPDKMCLDIDECAVGASECGPQQRCENFYGGHSCQCPAGHQLLGATECEDIDECLYGMPCSYSSKCINTVGSYRCECNEGFQNARTNDKVCVDIDECTETPGVCQQGCANAWGSYRCYCHKGYRLSEDGKTCVDIDECAEFAASAGSRSRARLCGGDCVNEPGSYRCACPQGYRLSDDQHSCIDIDECESGEATCARSSDPSKVCQNTRGSYHCHTINCPAGYQLEAKHRCTRIQRTCAMSDWDCVRQPSSYSYNFITFVANIYLPLGRVDLFTMHGPAWSESFMSFEMRLVDVQAAPGVTPATLGCFDTRPTGNMCVVSLLCALEGPQVVELELSMSLYQRRQFAGSAVARLIVIVSQYEY